VIIIGKLGLGNEQTLVSQLREEEEEEEVVVVTVTAMTLIIIK
jgi:hypothetical protein